MAHVVSSLLEQAKNDNLTDLEIVHRLCDEERASRMKSVVDRRVKNAKFPEFNTLDVSSASRRRPPQKGLEWRSAHCSRTIDRVNASAR